MPDQTLFRPWPCGNEPSNRAPLHYTPASTSQVISSNIMRSNAELLLQASNLNRSLSATAGVHDFSLRLHRGEILGLLGLNGAGKSTTLRLLSGTLVADSGTVEIAGHSLQDYPLLARQRVGFLPDQPPLFNDMKVEPYLRFCAKLRRVPADHITSRVEDVLDQCDLREVQRKRMAHLSKGFRQRVGLAQALVHEPDVLLLDEPSNGLDPNQMQGMRDVIQHVGQNHAVIFSTHLLNEAEAVCNRVAVMNRGRLIHDGKIQGTDNKLDALFTGLAREQPAAVSA